jgi:thioredoxin-dependent peroxiredoxin
MATKEVNKPPFGTLKEGSKMPSFKGVNQNDEVINSKNYAGKKLVIYFYPKDDTPTCTTQACNIRDNYALLQKHGFTVIGLSTDAAKKHKKFEAKYSLPFILIADENHSIAEKFGVWGTKQFMGKVYDGIHRTTFVVAEDGKIKNIITKPDTKNHTQQILDLWNGKASV